MNVMIAGMFRSGTTMLARKLSTHPNIYIASDPFFQFFKYVTNLSVAKANNATPDFASTIKDLFSYRNPDLTDYLDTKLNLKDLSLPSSDTENLIQDIAIYAERDSPWIIPHLNGLDPTDSFEVAYHQLFDIIRTSYAPDKAVCGFKLTFSDHLLPTLLRSDPKLKVIIPLRNPKSILLSQLAALHSGEDVYPTLYITRKWRESARAALRLTQNPRVYIIRLEDIIDRPQHSYSSLIEFLEQDFSPNLFDDTLMKDGNQNPWHINTAYRKNTPCREDLCRRYAGDIQFLEVTCYPEMFVLDYALGNRQMDEKAINRIESFESQIPTDRINEFIREEADYSISKATLDDESKRIRRFGDLLGPQKHKDRVTKKIINDF